jgi:DNA replication protein DnaC
MSNECVVGSEKTAEVISADCVVAQPPEIISNDHEYINKQFKVCDLLMRKYDMARATNGVSRDLKEPRNSASPNAKKRRKVPRSAFRKINAQLKAEDSLFWQSVETSVKQGRQFFFEKFASHYSLCLFEKRIILFLLCLEFNKYSKNSMPRDEIIALWDFDDSPVERICSAKYFGDDATLIQHNMIVFDRMRYTMSSNIECALNPLITITFSRLLSGENPSLDIAQKGQKLLCDRVGFVKEPEYKLNNVIMTDKIKNKILFFISTFKGSEDLDALGISETIKRGTGMVFLFYGPPGTGKTMLAEAIAKELGKKMLLVEYPKIMSRWVGDTDKNIATAFRAARKNDLVLVLDEADSLLYNRSYAIQEHDIRLVNEMLQELERFEGVVILTTNMEGLLDQALERRVSLKVKFDLPDESIRANIWKSHIPSTIKLGEEIDFRLLAKRYDFAGGYIKNAMLNALRRLALRKENRIMMDDLIFGADMEKDGMFNKDNYRKIIGFSEKL